MEESLEWVPKSRVTELPIWMGDRLFFRLLGEERPPFLLKLEYKGDTLTRAVVDGFVLLE